MVHTVPALVAIGLAMSFGSGTSGPEVLPAPPGPPAPVSKQGTLDRETVRYYIQLRQPAVRHCYERELGRHPDWHTSVTVELSIDPTGRVSTCKLGETDIERCVARAVCTIRFPYVYDTLENGETRVSSATTHVRYRFRFQPRKKKDKDKAQEQPRAMVQPDRTPKRVPPPPPHPPAARPAVAPAPAPVAPRPTTAPLPRIKIPRGNDPLDGIDPDTAP